MKKPKSKSAKKHTKKSNKPVTLELPPSWVDHLDWLPVGEKDTDSTDSAIDSHDISILSWNVLADAYCTFRSHPHLPLKFQRHVFDRPQRQHHVRRTLKMLAPMADLMALQEVDSPLGVEGCMQELGYQGLQTPTSAGGNDGRVDSCALYWNSQHYSCLEHEIVRLDDIAIMCTGSEETIEGATSLTTMSNLSGVQSSFCRKNMGLLVRLQHQPSKREIVVAVVHLHWNPVYEYVKLCQAHYVMTRAKAFCQGSTPFLLCGDFNSKPNSYVHRYLAKGVVNAKLVAPWYHTDEEDNEAKETEKVATSTEVGAPSKAASPEDVIVSGVQGLAISSESTKEPQVRYLLDYTLNRFCRWLRILGLDAALETEEEERLRTKECKFTIFYRCFQERRTLVTTSSRLLARKDCPPGAYVLDTKSLRNLEIALVHLLLSHGVKLTPKNFLTRCVVCNGSIDKVHDEKRIQEIFSTYKAPEALNDEKLDVYQCAGCSQGYWWCDHPSSSASRVKNQATTLLEVCMRGGVPVDEDMAMFDYVDAKKVKSESPAGAEEVMLLQQRLDVLGWLQEEELTNPFGPLKSAYSRKDGEESLVFTNVTSDFLGNLDYIFFPEDRLAVKDKLYVPTTLKELNSEDIRNGHLLPSNVWPSDHMAVGARLSFAGSAASSSTVTTVALSTPVKEDVEVAPESKEGDLPQLSTEEPTSGEEVPLFCAPVGSQSAAPPPPPQPTPIMHAQRCPCGCVPNILSLFEMAELRKKARLKQLEKCK